MQQCNNATMQQCNAWQQASKLFNLNGAERTAAPVETHAST
jgi:hypothetical protein